MICNLGSSANCILVASKEIPYAYSVLCFSYHIICMIPRPLRLAVGALRATPPIVVKKHGKVEKRQKFVKARGRSAKPRVAVFLRLQHTHVCRCKNFLVSKIEVSLLTLIVGIYGYMSCLLTRA
jgi:hypothetical protein